VTIDLNLELRAIIRDNLLSTRFLSNGDIFRRIRRAYIRHDLFNKRKWLNELEDERECALSLERDAAIDNALGANGAARHFTLNDLLFDALALVFHPSDGEERAGFS